jgi:hypothetical protein
MTKLGIPDAKAHDRLAHPTQTPREKSAIFIRIREVYMPTFSSNAARCFGVSTIRSLLFGVDRNSYLCHYAKS